MDYYITLVGLRNPSVIVELKAAVEWASSRSDYQCDFYKGWKLFSFAKVGLRNILSRDAIQIYRMIEGMNEWKPNGG